MKLNKNGLSTVKIITVMAITSLWVSIALPALFHFNIESNEAQALGHIQKLTNACEKFKAQNGKYPENLQALSKFIKEGLTSPGYHFQYEFLYEGFILVGLPNNSFTGNNGFYRDSEGTSLVVPEVTTTKGAMPGIINSMARQLRLSGKIKELRAAAAPPLVSITNTNGLMDEQVDTTSSEPAQVVKIGTTSELTVRKENNIQLPKQEEAEFEKFVVALESISSAISNSAALAKNETKTSGPLAAIDKNKDIFQVNYREQFSLAKTKEMDTSVTSTSSSTGSSTSSTSSTTTTTTTTTTSSTTSSTSTEDTSGRTKIPQHKR